MKIVCSLQMALAKMKGVTAIHLVKRSKTGQTTRVISVTEGSPTDPQTDRVSLSLSLSLCRRAVRLLQYL